MLKPSVQVREEDGVLTAEFWDCLRLDPTPVADLRKAFDEYRKRTNRAEVVVDLNGVAFAGSAALGGFLAMKRAGARILFCNVDATVREVFRVSHLDPLFVFVDDKPTALIQANLRRDTPPDGLAPIEAPRTPAQSGPTPLKRRKTN